VRLDACDRGVENGVFMHASVNLRPGPYTRQSGERSSHDTPEIEARYHDKYQDVHTLNSNAAQPSKDTFKQRPSLRQVVAWSVHTMLATLTLTFRESYPPEARCQKWCPGLSWCSAWPCASTSAITSFSALFSQTPTLICCTKRY